MAPRAYVAVWLFCLINLVSSLRPDTPVAKPLPSTQHIQPYTVETSLEEEGEEKRSGATGDPSDDSDADSVSAGEDDHEDDSDGTFEVSKRSFGVLKSRVDRTQAAEPPSPTAESQLDLELRRAIEHHIYNPPPSTQSEEDYNAKLSEATLRLDRRTLYLTILAELSPNATSTSATSRWIDIPSTRELKASVALTSAPGWRSHLEAGATYSDAFLSKRGVRLDGDGNTATCAMQVRSKSVRCELRLYF